MVGLPKLYKDESTDFSTNLEMLKELRGLSDLGMSLVQKMTENATVAHENIYDNSFLIQEEKKNDLLLGYIEDIQDATERETLTKAFEDLKKSYDKNTHWWKHIGTQIYAGVVERVEQNGGVTSLSMLGQKVQGVKESFVSSLSPFWKGLYDIGSSIYHQKIENRTEVHEDISKILEDIKKSKKTSEDEESNTTSTSTTKTTEEVFSDVSNVEGSNTTRNFDDVTESIHHIEDTTERMYGRLDDILARLVTNEDGEFDSETYQSIIESVNDNQLLINELETFYKYANEEERELLKELLNDPERFSSLIQMESERLKDSYVEVDRDGRLFTEIPDYETFNERKKQYYEESMGSIPEFEYPSDRLMKPTYDATEVTRLMAQSFIDEIDAKEKDDDVSYASKEREENFNRESLKQQRQLNEKVDAIYSFISGKKSSKGETSKGGDGENIFSKGMDFLMKFLGGKFLASSIGKRLIGSKIAKKVVNSKILKNTKIGKILGGMGIGAGATSDMVEAAAERTTKEAAKKTTSEALEKTTKEATENIAKNTTETIAKNSVDDVAKAGVKTVEKAGTKTVAKSVGKGIGKSLLKKIPGISLLAGGAFAVDRLMDGDVLGALGEFASGLAGTIPFFGTALSTGIDAGLMVRDITKENQSEEIIPEEPQNDQSEPRMKSVSIGGQGADDFTFDSLIEEPKESVIPSKPVSQPVPEPKSKIVLPEVGSITDMDFDYSTFDPYSEEEPIVTSKSGDKNFTPVVDSPKSSSWRTTKDEIYSKHMTQTDDGKVLERHVSDVKDIKSDLKAYFDKRSFNKSDARKKLGNEDIVSTYNNSLLKEVYGENYSVKITPYGVYDTNNEMAFTPVVKDEQGIITKILKNPSDHIKPGEEGYINPNTNFFDEEAKFSEERNQLYDQTLSTRSTEEQTDRKRLNELQEQSFWGDLSNEETQEKSMLEQKVASSYEPVLTKEQENQYSLSGRMSNLIDNTVGRVPVIGSMFSAVTSIKPNLDEPEINSTGNTPSLFDKIVGSIPLVGSIYSAFKSTEETPKNFIEESNGSVSTERSDEKQLAGINTTSQLRSQSNNPNELIPQNNSQQKIEKNKAYISSATRGGEGVSSQSQQAPTIINNNYNTSNTNVSSSGGNKPTPPPQILVNPTPAYVWQGSGWGGMR